MNIFYAESPLQLICMSQFINKGDLLLLRPTSSTTHQQFIETMSHLNLDRLRVKLFSGSNKIDRAYALLMSFLILLFYSKRTWHIGYFRSKLTYVILKIHPKRELYIYDDGAATLSILKEINWEKHSNIQYRTIFPVEDLGKGCVEKICLDKQIVKQNHVSVRCFEHIFIGTKLVEIGKLSIKDYIAILQKLRKVKNVKHYLKHRDESIEKMHIIESLGFEIISINVPFELSILSNQLNVERVYGVLTTVLLTSQIALDIPAYCVRVADKIKYQRERAYNFENTLEKFNVNLLKL